MQALGDCKLIIVNVMGAMMFGCCNGIGKIRFLNSIESE